MNVEDQINELINSQAEPKRSDMRKLHDRILQLSPDCKLWYTDGKNSEGKMVTNPDAGYGSCTINYKDKTSREFYRIGLSGTKTGISVYIIGLEDKKYLPDTYGGKIGKAKVSGYCISFKKLEDINIDVLEDAVRFGFEYENKGGNQK
ncbi:hypothetical protein D3C87_152040 [compost metagenome]